jgi:hypothetical protein
MAVREQTNERTKDAVTTSRRWAEYLVAVLVGNIVYLFLEPQLPEELRHRIFRVDLGLAVDFLICVVAYGLVRLVRSASVSRSC